VLDGSVTELGLMAFQPDGPDDLGKQGPVAFSNGSESADHLCLSVPSLKRRPELTRSVRALIKAIRSVM
jgi:hypothetical protein